MDSSHHYEGEDQGAASWLKAASLFGQVILFSALRILGVFIIQHTIIQTFFTLLFLKIWCILPLLYLSGRCFSSQAEENLHWLLRGGCLLFTMQLPWQVFLIATSRLPSPPFSSDIAEFLVILGYYHTELLTWVLTLLLETHVRHNYSLFFLPSFLAVADVHI